jgi:hypothetical protein
MNVGPLAMIVGLRRSLSARKLGQKGSLFAGLGVAVCGPLQLAMPVREANAGATWRRHRLWVFWVWMVALCVGCANLLMPSGPSDRDIQAMIDRNTRNLRHLQVDLFEEYVLDIMGPPQRLEGYPWGTVWLYRTALTKGVRTTPESDFTPLVFDRHGVLLGWGRDILATYSQRQPSVGGVRR